MKKLLSLILTALLIAGAAGSAFAAVLGDVDADGSVSAADARLALRAAVGLDALSPSSAAFAAADVDFSKAVTAADARAILRAAVGLDILTPDGPVAVPKKGLPDAEAVRRFRVAMDFARDWLSPVSGAYTIDKTKSLPKDGKTYYLAKNAKYKGLAELIAALREYFEPSVFNAYVKEHYTSGSEGLYVLSTSDVILQETLSLAVAENTETRITFVVTATGARGTHEETYVMQPNKSGAWVFTGTFEPLFGTFQ